MYCVRRVLLQTGGWTPLHIASRNGHVDCVHALLGGGAAINQEDVSFAGSIGRSANLNMGAYLHTRLLGCATISCD